MLPGPTMAAETLRVITSPLLGEGQPNAAQVGEHCFEIVAGVGVDGPVHAPRQDDVARLERHPERPDLAGQPLALVITAEFDPLRDEAMRYAERLSAANVPVFSFCYPSFSHGFALMTRASPAAARAIERIARAVGQTLRSGRLPVSPDQVSGDNRTQ